MKITVPLTKIFLIFFCCSSLLAQESERLKILKNTISNPCGRLANSTEWQALRAELQLGQANADELQSLRNHVVSLKKTYFSNTVLSCLFSTVCIGVGIYGGIHPETFSDATTTILISSGMALLGITWLYGVAAVRQANIELLLQPPANPNIPGAIEPNPQV